MWHALCGSKGLCALAGRPIDVEFLFLCFVGALLAGLLCCRRHAERLEFKVSMRQLNSCMLVLVLALLPVKGHDLTQEHDAESVMLKTQLEELNRQRSAAANSLPYIERLLMPEPQTKPLTPFDFANSWRIQRSSFNSWGYGAMPISTRGSAVVCDNATRLGSPRDGGKVACLDGKPALSPQAGSNCLVVSVGSHGDFSFEEAVHALNPRCRIDTWDGTLTAEQAARAPPYVRLERSNFQSNSWQHYRHRQVAALKMDCEGCEHAALLPFVHHTCTNLLMVELHRRGMAANTTLMGLLLELNKTFALYYAEANPSCAGRCNEYALRRRRWCHHGDHGDHGDSAPSP